MKFSHCAFLLVPTVTLLASAQAVPDWKAAEAVLSAKCYECHNPEKSKGDIDLKRLAADPKVAEEFEIWADVKDTIENGDMPPRKAKQLAPEEKGALLGWVAGALELLAEAKSGDPGPVTMRRLTNAEYDNTIRDLTGRNYELAREFQSDGGGGEDHDDCRTQLLEHGLFP